MPRGLKHCHNFADLRDLARRRLPGPIFHYIDGAAEDETTYRRNTAAFEQYDLVPNVLAGVADIDMSVEVMGFKLGLPIFARQLRCNACSITRVKGGWRWRRKNIKRCLGFPLWARCRFKKLVN